MKKVINLLSEKLQEQLEDRANNRKKLADYPNMNENYKNDFYKRIEENNKFIDEIQGAIILLS